MGIEEDLYELTADDVAHKYNYEHIVKEEERNKKRWEIDHKIEKLFAETIKEIPWEGAHVNKTKLKNGLMEIIEELLTNE